jgi:hypothetical protein
MAIKLPDNDPLRKLGGIRNLRGLSEAIETNRKLQGALFPKVTEFHNIVRPLDKEVLRRASGAQFIGNQLRENLDQTNAALVGLGIGSSAALSASRMKIGDQVLQQAGLRIAELYGWQSGLGKIAARWREPLQGFGARIERFVEEQQKLDEQTNDFVQAHGWPIPLNLPFRAYRRIVGLAEAGKREVNRLMTRSFRPGTRVFRSTAEVLLESPQLESRRPLIKQALAAHRRREWYLVINGLLPLVEGVLVDYAFRAAPAPARGRPREAIKELRENEAASLGVTVDTLETMLLSAGANVALFERFDLADYGGRGEPRSLNRHAILHGAARRYGSEQNALRLVLLVAVMAEAFDLADVEV